MSMFESENWPAPNISGGSSMVYAGFWMRALAHICDGINSLVLILPLTLITGLIVSGGTTGALVSAAVSFSGMLLQAYWIGTRGGSPLRVKTGALVVDMSTGAYIGLSRAFVRTFVSNVFSLLILINPVLIVVPLLDILWMLRDPQKQTLHDKVVRSIVQQS